MKRTVILNLLKYVLAFGLLGYVVWSNWKPGNPTGLEQLWNKHVVQGQSVHLGYLALGATVLLTCIFITFFRWYLLVRAVGLPFRIVDALRLGLVGLFYNTFLPGSVGGDVVKAAGLAREQSRRTVAVATVIMDRAIALWALVWFVALLGSVFYLTGMLEGPGVATSTRILRISLIIVGVTSAVWLALGFLPERRAEKFAGRLENIPKIGGSAAEFWRAVWTYRCRPESVAVAMLVSWVGHVGFVCAFYLCVRTLWDPATGRIPTFNEHFLLVPIGLIIQAMPMFPGGAGIGEAGFGGLYAWFGCAAAVAIVGSLVQRVLMWIFGLAGYVVYLQMKSQTQEAAASPPEDASVEPGTALAATSATAG